MLYSSAKKVQKFIIYCNTGKTTTKNIQSLLFRFHVDGNPSVALRQVS